MSPCPIAMMEGTPNLDTHPLIRASAQETAVISFRGTAYNHLVDLSIAVKT
jgi:hypothetical protein